MPRRTFYQGSGLRVTREGLKDVQARVYDLTKTEVLVGFPDETAERTREDGLPTAVTNASLAYIHDNGAPEQNIPARPFMIPGIADAKDRLANKLAQLAKAVVQGKDVVAQGFTQVGLIAQASIRAKINEGVPPPLSEATLRDRARRGRKGAAEELANRAQGLPPSTDLAKPLVDTGQLRNAVNYVVRRRKARR